MGNPFIVHITYSASRWISIKFDSGMLSVPFNKTSNSNLYFEATSVLNMQGQSHRLLVNIDVCSIFFCDIKEEKKYQSMCTPVEANFFQSSLLSSCKIVNFRLLRTPFCHVVSLHKQRSKVYAYFLHTVLNTVVG